MEQIIVIITKRLLVCTEPLLRCTLYERSGCLALEYPSICSQNLQCLFLAEYFDTDQFWLVLLYCFDADTAIAFS